MSSIIPQKYIRASFFALLLLLVAPGAGADSAASLMSVPQSAVVPEGLSWAKPLAGGPLKVLMVLPRFAIGEPDLLADRIDLDLHTIALWDRAHLGFDPAVQMNAPPEFSAEAVTRDLEDSLKKKWDVMALANIELDALPAGIQQQIVEKVSAGTGLLLAHDGMGQGPIATALGQAKRRDSSLPVTRGTPTIMVTEELDAASCVELQTLSNGHVVQFHFPRERPVTQALIPLPSEETNLDPSHLDNCTSLIARAMMWAANRPFPVNIVSLADMTPPGPDPEEIPPDLPQAYVDTMTTGMGAQMLRPFRVQFNPPTDTFYTLETRLRRVGVSDNVYTTTSDLAAGSIFYETPLLLGPGNYNIDARLISRKGVVEWFTRTVHLEGWPRLEDVRYTKGFLLPNDSLALEIEVPGIFSSVRTATIYARATDSFGRRVAEAHEAIAAEGGTVTLQLNFADLIAPLIKVEIYAVEGERDSFSDITLGGSDYDVHFFAVRQRRAPLAPQLLACVDRPWEPLAREQLERLKEAGYDTVSSPADASSLVAAAQAGLWLLPEVAGYRADVARHGTERVPCLTDSAFVSPEMQRLAEETRFQWAGGPGRYSLGNPNYLCASDEPVCQSPSCLSALRARLVSDYGDLTTLNAAWQTGFLSWEDVGPEGLETIAPVAIDFRTQMDEVFTRFHDLAAEQVHAVDSDGSAGFRARSDRHPNNGYDWRGLSKTLDWLAFTPDSFTVEALRSFRRPEQYLALASDGTEQPAVWLPWYAAFHQIAGVWRMGALGDPNQPEVRPVMDGLNLSEAGRAQTEIFKLLNDGIGSLLLAATREHSGIALVDHPAARTLARVEAGYELRDLQEAWIALLEGLGYQYDVLDGRELTAENLSAYRVLVLPGLCTLDDGELRTLQTFCDAGGTLLADGPLGTHDTHGRPREEAFTPKPTDTPRETGEPMVTLSDSPYPMPAAIRGQARRVEEVLTTAGCRKFFPDATPDELLDGECVAWDFNGARIWGVLMKPGEKGGRRKFALPFDRDAHVYDLLTQASVPRAHRAKVSLAPGEVALYAGLPYEVEKLDVVCESGVLAGSRLEVAAMLKVKEGTPGDHFFHCSITTAGGTSLPFHDHVLRAKGGRLTTYFPIARNRVPGNYMLHVRDVLTGASADAPFAVGTPGE